MTLKRTIRILPFLILSILLCISLVAPVYGQLGSPNPTQSGTTGLQGKIPSPAPTTPATISSPISGRTFDAIPITVSGLCKTGLLVKIFSNDIFIGSADCAGGSYSIQVDLFGGQNDLIARVYDALDQAGPDSNKVTVTFQDNQFAAFGQRISLLSNLAKLGAPVGQSLTWPIILSGGSGPYAITVDWGDGTAADLKSQPFAGTFDITHTYKSAGIYRVVVKATDVTGATAFLQLVGVGAGDVTQSTTGSKGGTNGGGTTKVVYIWWPLLFMLPLLLAMFWVGKRYELSAIHRQLEEQSRMYGNEIQR
ncbi:PKD domain-containing protein [Candidatus Saccharibacteria bacterium]|nr:MAG: PKD domain-containing protein [Candidatus Saccharibacteria bacterium]